MEYYAKSRQKILTQGEIDKVKNELEDLIMNLEGELQNRYLNYQK